MPKTYEEVEDEIIRGGKGFASFKRMLRDMLNQGRTFRLLVLSILVTAVTSTIAYYAIGLVADQIKARKSVEKIMSMQPSLILSGHGKPLSL